MGLRTKQLSGDQDSDRGARFTAGEWPPPEGLTCPRCGSLNTKFCYYNNYNKSQPRHLCKACKRHWTKGGVLRNIPIGGVRKNKRVKSSIPAEDRWKSLIAPVSEKENHHKNRGSCSNPIEEKGSLISSISSSHVSPLGLDSLELETSSLSSLDIPMSGSFWPALNSGIGDYWNFDEIDLSTYSVMDTATEFNNLKP